MTHDRLNIYTLTQNELELSGRVEMQSKAPNSLVAWGGEVYYVDDTRLIKYSVDHDKEVKYLS